MLSLHVPALPVRWSWITLIGPDAQDFLHRLTTAQVRELPVGRGALACFLNPQGKIRAAFRLWNHRPTEYAFEFDAGPDGKWRQELLSAIDQFTFSEKMVLNDVSGSPDPENTMESRWFFLEPGESAAAALGVPLEEDTTAALDEEIRLCHQGSRDFGRPWITAWGRPARLDQWIDRAFPGLRSVARGQLESWRVEAVRPAIDAEITANANPLEIGLADAIAPNKGCYPGQEVIEKIVALGAPARRLARLDGDGTAPRPGEKIYNLAEPPVEVGEITSVSSAGTGFAALGIVRKIHAKEGLQVKLTQGALATIRRVAPYA